MEIEARPELALASDLDALVTWVSRNTPSRMSYTALRTLSRLQRQGAARITELADAERVSQPAMTNLLQRLGADGLVERTQDPDDGRATSIAITAAGRAVLAEVRADRAELIASLLADLTPGQRSALGDALGALRPKLSTPNSPRKASQR